MKLIPVSRIALQNRVFSQTSPEGGTHRQEKEAARDKEAPISQPAQIFVRYANLARLDWLLLAAHISVEIKRDTVVCLCCKLSCIQFSVPTES